MYENHMLRRKITPFLILLLVSPLSAFAQKNDLCISILEENSVLYEKLYDTQKKLSDEMKPVKWISKTQKNNLEQEMLRTEVNYEKANRDILTRKNNAVWTGDVVECAPILYEKQKKLKNQIKAVSVEITAIINSKQAFKNDSKNSICAANGNCVNVARSYYINNVEKNYDIPKLLGYLGNMTDGFKSKIQPGINSDKEEMECKLNIISNYDSVLTMGEVSKKYISLLKGLTFMDTNIRDTIIKNVELWQQFNNKVIELIVKIKDNRMDGDVSALCSEVYKNTNILLKNQADNYRQTTIEIDKFLASLNEPGKACSDNVNCSKQSISFIMNVINKNNEKFLSESNITISNINKIIGSMNRK